MEYDLKWDIIIVGETGVGKTSLMNRYAKNQFTEHYKATVAVDYLYKHIQVRGRNVKLNIWDSAGQEVYKSIIPQYFRNANGCILVYDVTRLPTFNQLSGWLSEFRTFNESAPVIIVGNKCEDPDQKAVNRSVVRSFAQQEGMDFMECSAKTGHNVQQVFDMLLHKIWNDQCPSESSSLSHQQGEGGAAAGQPHPPELARHDLPVAKVVPTPKEARDDTSDEPRSIVLTKKDLVPSNTKQKSGCC